MEQQTIDAELGATPVPLEMQWGANAPKGARVVFSRIIKEGAHVPLFLGQTMINALRDLGYNHTTSAVCEHVDNSFQWGAKDVRLYFHEKGPELRLLVDIADGHNYADMARDRSMTISAVKSKVFRAREKVRTSQISAALRCGLRR